MEEGESLIWAICNCLGGSQAEYVDVFPSNKAMNLSGSGCCWPNGKQAGNRGLQVELMARRQPQE